MAIWKGNCGVLIITRRPGCSDLLALAVFKILCLKSVSSPICGRELRLEPNMSFKTQ